MSKRVLSFHYTLTGTDGKQIDSSRGGQPFPVMEGSMQIIPGLEEVLFKMTKGEKKIVQVPAEKAYGKFNDKLKLKVPKSKLPASDLQVGMQFRGGNEEHAPIFTIIQIEGDTVHLDGNHPLAGQDLTFDVEVVEIREATAQEMQHGHAHGAHGHDH